MYVPKNGAPAYISQKPKEDKNRQFNNNSQRLYYPTFNCG